MTFEFLNPVYYVGDRSQSWNPPAALAGLEAQIDDLIAQSVQSGNVITDTLKMTAKIGVPGQVLGETVEIVVEADGNTIQFKDGAGFVLEQVIEATGSAALPFLYTAGAAVLGTTPMGWLAITAAVGGEVFYSTFLENNVEQLIEQITNTVDSEFKLVNAAGETLGGVWYRGGLLASGVFTSVPMDDNGRIERMIA